MTSTKLLDGFSEVLMRDERILSPQERQLLICLLQNSKEASGSNPEIQSAVRAAIARSVGETVAQRAFTLLGSSIVEQIIAHGVGGSGSGEFMPSGIFAGPQPPSPQAPSAPHDEPDDDDDHPPGPQPPTPSPGISLRQRAESIHRSAGQGLPENEYGIAVMNSTATIRAQCVVLDEFLAPQEMESLLRYTMDHEDGFRSSEVISPNGQPGTVDYSHRRSRVLMKLGAQEEIIMNRVRAVLPRVLEELQMEEFPITRTEVQITASNDGDFFRAHCDDAQEKIASRRMTFVYFFHREPRPFEGGELRLYDSQKGEHSLGKGNYQTIIPQQNQIVFFPCSTLHEITPVRCQSLAFADSRFTANGWLHK
jgi:SM-20-related protein